MVLNTNKTDHHSITELLLIVVLNNNKTDHHSITELLLTVVLNTNKTDHHCITDLLLIDSGGKHQYKWPPKYNCSIADSGVKIQ